MPGSITVGLWGLPASESSDVRALDCVQSESDDSILAAPPGWVRLVNAERPFYGCVRPEPDIDQDPDDVIDLQARAVEGRSRALRDGQLRFCGAANIESSDSDCTQSSALTSDDSEAGRPHRPTVIEPVK